MKKVSFALAALTLLASCSGLLNEAPTTISSAADRAAAPVVQLVYAKTYRSPVDGATSLQGYVEVQNLAYAKKVVLHYTTDNLVWKDLEAVYDGATSPGFEKWAFQTPAKIYEYQGYDDFTFAIKYVVNGQTYWDNNGGKNYKAQTGSMIHVYPAALGKNAIVPDSADFIGSSSIFNISACLKNLAYAKKVEVIYSWDNFKSTSAIAPLNYVLNFPNGNNVEYWSVGQLPIEASAQVLTYYLRYTVAGQTYYDNNFGQNYTVYRN